MNPTRPQLGASAKNAWETRPSGGQIHGRCLSRQPDTRRQTDRRTQRQPAQLRRAAIDVRSVTMWFVSGTAAPAAGQHSLDGGGRQASRRQLADYESLWRRF